MTYRVWSMTTISMMLLAAAFAAGAATGCDQAGARPASAASAPAVKAAEKSPAAALQTPPAQQPPAAAPAPAAPAKTAPSAEAPAAAKTPAAKSPAATAAPVAPAAPAAGPVVERIGRLDNGLRVIVRERHIGGVAALRIYVGAGSLNEGDYVGYGLSHLLEHVVAGGTTTTRTEDQIQAALQAIGAQTNAHTSKQFVCYHGQSSGDRVNDLIDIIADTVMNCKIDAKEFAREHEVVQREIERGEADPARRLFRLWDETYFLNHPARYPVIGYMAAVKALTRDDLDRYYRRIVVPDNAVVVAVGDFSADAVYEKIKQTMGGWSRRPFEPTVLPPRETQIAPRLASAEMDVASVRTVLSFPTVQLTHPDLYPLDILAFILGEGPASRLVADLRDQRGLVQGIDVASHTPAGYDGGEFAVIFEATPDKADAARAAILEHLTRAVREKVTDAELARAKRQKIAEHAFSLQECESIASDMGTNALLVGDPHFSDQYVRAIQKVTADEVQRVAAAYLRPDVLTTATIGPKRPAAAAAASAPAAKRPEIIARVLPNGVRMLLCPVEDCPTVSIQMVVRGGLSVEDAKSAGTSSLMAQLLLKGTPKRTTAQIAELLDSMGAAMNASAGLNTVFLSARCLAGDFEKTFDLAADCMLAPTFPADEIERMRMQTLAGLAHMSDTPQGEAGLYFNRVFFKDSPYQFPVQGTPESVKALTRDDLAAWHKKYVAGNNLVVAVFGGIDLVKAARHVAAAVEKLPANKALAFPTDQPPRKVPAREVYIKPTEKKAAIVYVAYPGMDVYNVRDRFPMDVLDTVISGYQMPSGWLHEELRGKGLVYEVHAFSRLGLRPGYFTARAVCQPEKVPEVVAIIENDFLRATRETFTPEQLGPAKATIVTAMELGRETVDQAALESAVSEAVGLGYGFPREEANRIRQVQADDLSRVAREYFKKPVIVILTSDEKKAEEIRK